MSKIAFLVMYEVPYPSMVGAEEPKKFEFNTSALLEKSLKAPPSHSSRLLFFFCFLFSLGARVWALIPCLQYQERAGYVSANRKVLPHSNS